MILQNSRTSPGQKALFQIPGVFQDQGQIQGSFQVCANPGRLISTFDVNIQSVSSTANFYIKPLLQ